MKYLKKYEDISIGEPEVGDYVLCKDYITGDIDSRIKSKIGKVIEKELTPYEGYRYTILYDSTVKRFTYFKRKLVAQYSIMIWSKDKEELEARLAINKYNL